MSKLFTSLVTVQFACNNHEANSREDYIDLLKRQYQEFYNIDLQDYEITDEQLKAEYDALGIVNKCNKLPQ